MGIVNDLAVFLRARLNEEDDTSMLFHEFACPALQQSRRAAVCSCPAPARIRGQTATCRRILADCEQRIRREQDQGGWPLDSILALTAMKALALPFELHPAGQDTCTPEPKAVATNSPRSPSDSPAG